MRVVSHAPSQAIPVPRKATEPGSAPSNRGPFPRPAPPPLSVAKARKAVRTQRMPGTDVGAAPQEIAATSMAEAFATATNELAPSSVVTQPSAVVDTRAVSNGAAGSVPSPAAPPINLMLDDIDSGFDAIVGPGRQGAASTNRPEDLLEPQALFAQIAATQTRPIRDFMVELRLGDASREWVRVCMPGVKSLRKSAEDMGLADLAKALDGYHAALELADTQEGTVVGSEARDLITSAYQDLAAQMPNAFTLEEDGDRREPIIVQSLLAQIPDVRKVALDKIYAAGLTSLSAFYVAKPSDIAEATGIAMDLCQRIWERFQRYRRQISEMPPDVDRTAEHKRLAELAAQLARLNTAYEGGVVIAGENKDKKQIRQERTETILEINMLLARLGEVRRVELLERLPFQRKLEELERYLKAHNSKPRPF